MASKFLIAGFLKNCLVSFKTLQSLCLPTYIWLEILAKSLVQKEHELNSEQLPFSANIESKDFSAIPKPANVVHALIMAI